jgi:hypothetical protein
MWLAPYVSMIPVIMDTYGAYGPPSILILYLIFF